MGIIFSIVDPDNPTTTPARHLHLADYPAKCVIDALIAPHIADDDSVGELATTTTLAGCIDPDVIILSVVQNRILETSDGDPYFASLADVPAEYVATLFELCLEAAKTNRLIRWG